MAYGRKTHDLRSSSTGVTSSHSATRTACERYRLVPAVASTSQLPTAEAAWLQRAGSRAISKCMAMCCPRS